MHEYLHQTPEMRKVFVETVCIAFIILFVYATASKWLTADKFLIELQQSPVASPYAQLIFWILPALEIIAAALLAWPSSKAKGLYLSFGLMSAFTAYIIAITRFSEFVPCSCGGVLSSMGWNAHLVFNLIFLALAGVAILVMPRPKDPSRAKSLLLQ